jgi:uncharacterized protein (TIGR03067 family)
VGDVPDAEDSVLRRNTAGIIFLLFVASIFGIAQAQRETAKNIEGTWVVASAERELDAYPELEGATVTFTGKTFRIERLAGRSTWFGNVMVDYGKGTIDFDNQAKLLIPPVFGTKWEGIFRWDGDMLEICTAEGHDARPTEFLSGYDLTLMKLRRK